MRSCISALVVVVALLFLSVSQEAAGQASPAGRRDPTESLTEADTAAVADCGCLEQAAPLVLYSEGYPGVWPPCVGGKLKAQMHVRNRCGYPVIVRWLGAKGRRSGDTEYWDMIYENIEISAGDTWVFEPNIEKPLEPGSYSFQYTCSPDGNSWSEFGDQKTFTAAASCGPTSTPVTRR